MEIERGSVVSLAAASEPARRATWLVALAFGLACLAWLDATSTYHGDERFYFDAALRMWSGETWWAPEYADGSARVNKPLLSYWIAAGSMEVLGPHVLAGRLPFVIAAVALLLATGRLARALLPGEHAAAALVPAMLAATSTIVTLATRCTPDILLVLGVTCTWIGLAELLVAGRSPASCARWIWGGCALAAAAKGSLALVTALFALASIWQLRRETFGVVARSPAVLLGGSLALAAIAPVALRSAAAPGRSFLEDQVTAKIASSPLDWIATALGYASTLVRHLLPWSAAAIIVALLARPRFTREFAARRRSAVLALAFASLLLVVFSFSSTQRGRYLAPAYPALLALFAPVAMAYDQWRHSRRTSAVLLALLSVVSIVGALALARIDLRAGATCAALGCALALLAWKMPLRSPTIAGALGVALVQLVGAPAIRHAFRSTHVELAAASPQVHAVWELDPPTTSSLLRFESGRRHAPEEWNAEPSEAQLAAVAAVLAGESGAEALRARGWSVVPCGFMAIRPSFSQALKILAAPDSHAAFERLCLPAFLATRP